MLCERCAAEIEGDTDLLPMPWFDYAARTIAGKHVEPSVWELLKILWHRRKGGYVSTDQIMNLLYSNNSNPPEDAIVRSYVSRLRQKLDLTPYAIDTLWKEGWRLIDRSQVEMGNLETGVLLPKPRLRGTTGKDKYRLGDMEPGQSRIIVNTSIQALRKKCRRDTNDARPGVFEAGFDDEGRMRIWRTK